MANKKLSDLTVKDVTIFMLQVLAGFIVFCGLIMLVILFGC